MEFRLTYKGRLPAQSSSESRLKEKHAIRRVFHKQLRQLWHTHPFTSRYTELFSGFKPYIMNYQGTRQTVLIPLEGLPILRTVAERIGYKYRRCGYRFVPLIGEAFGAGTETVCALDILFLRRDPPGRGLIVSGGDIDNRLKVLFDAMRMPENCDEVRGVTPADDENPFFCLLQDDNLITDVKVTTDQLLTPLESDENVNDVQLIIHVKSMAVGREFADLGLTAEERDALRKQIDSRERQIKEHAEYRERSGENDAFRRTFAQIPTPPGDEGEPK